MMDWNCTLWRGCSGVASPRSSNWDNTTMQAQYLGQTPSHRLLVRTLRGRPCTGAGAEPEFWRDLGTVLRARVWGRAQGFVQPRGSSWAYPKTERNKYQRGRAQLPHPWGLLPLHEEPCELPFPGKVRDLGGPEIEEISFCSQRVKMEQGIPWENCTSSPRFCIHILLQIFTFLHFCNLWVQDWWSRLWHCEAFAYTL